MAYYEISRNPQLTLSELREKIRAQLPAVSGIVEKNYLTFRDDSAIGVRIGIAQAADGTLLRAQIIQGRLNTFLWLFIRAFPPALVVYLLLLPVIARQGLLGEMERCILAAFPGSSRLPVGEGTRRSRPAFFRFLGFLKILGGLIAASLGVGLAHFWYNTPGLAPAQLVAAAIPAGLGLTLVYAGVRNLALSLLDWRGFAAAAFICTVLSPYLFKACWTYAEHVRWRWVLTESGELYNYRILPRGLWRVEFCMKTAQWRADQWTKDRVADSFIKNDLEMVVKAIDEFHPASPAYQPAYRLAKSTLASLDTH